MIKATQPGCFSRACFLFMMLSGSTALSVDAHALPVLPAAGISLDHISMRSPDNASDSPYDMGQLKILKAKILQQQESGRHTAALESIDQALYLLRVDGGPENPAQLPLLEKRLDSLQALGRLTEIDQQYQGMLHLYRSLFGADDVRTATLLGRYAQWQMQAFYQELHDTSPEAPGYATAADRRTQAFDMLAQSQLNLIDAIKAQVKAGNWPSSDLQELEEHLLESYYLFAWRDALVADPGQYLQNRSTRTDSVYRRSNMDTPQFIQAYQQGELVLERLLTYQQKAVNKSPEEEGKVLVAKADWDLLFGHKKEALSLYREATQWLTTQPGQPARELDPLHPVLLPTFTPREAQPFSSEFEEGAHYIDVSFSVTRYGRARNIEITGQSQLQDDEAQKRLVGWLKQGQFRPRFVGNEIDESAMKLRYYYQ